MEALDQLLATLKAAHEKATPTRHGETVLEWYDEDEPPRLIGWNYWGHPPKGEDGADFEKEADAQLYMLLRNSLPAIIAALEVCAALHRISRTLEEFDGDHSCVDPERWDALWKAEDALAHVLAGETPQEPPR